MLSLHEPQAQARYLACSILTRRIFALCGFLVFADILLMICDHVFCEHLVKFCADIFSKSAFCLAFGSDGGFIPALGGIGCLLVSGGVIDGKHFAIRPDFVALTILLRKVSHANFGEVAFYCLL
jgi:hypothetical protein